MSETIKHPLVTILTGLCLAFSANTVEASGISTPDSMDSGAINLISRVNDGQETSEKKPRKFNFIPSPETQSFIEGFWMDNSLETGEFFLYNFTNKKIGTFNEQESHSARGFLSTPSETLPVFRLIRHSLVGGHLILKEHQYCTGEGAYHGYSELYNAATINLFRTFKFDAEKPLSETAWFASSIALGMNRNELKWSLSKETTSHKMRRLTINEYEIYKALLGTATIDEVVQSLEDTNEDVRKCAAEVLLFRGGSEAVDPLIIALWDENAEVRKFAVRALGESGDERAIAPLIEVLENGDPEMQEAAARGLAKKKDPEVAIALLTILGSDNKTLHYIAEFALKETRDLFPFEVLIDCASDKNIDVREYCVSVLAERRDPSTTETLYHSLDGISPSISKEVEAALQEMGNTFSVELLIQGLDEGGRRTRSYSYEELEKRGKLALEPLIVALRTGDPALKTSACKLLGEAHDTRAIEPLISFLNDGDYNVRTEAKVALKRITAQDFGSDAKKWQKWWKKNQMK